LLISKWKKNTLTCNSSPNSIQTQINLSARSLLSTKGNA
jgi:hypothetical protein